MIKTFVGNLLLLSIFSCGLPKDPHASWETAKKEGLKVGVVQNPPFSYVDNGGRRVNCLHLLGIYSKIVRPEGNDQEDSNTK